MKDRHFCLTLIITAVFSFFPGNAAFAQGNRHSLADFGGAYAGKSVGITTVCTNAGGCSAFSPVLEEKNFGAVTRAVFDESGNFCGTATATSTPVGGVLRPSR